MHRLYGRKPSQEGSKRAGRQAGHARIGNIVRQAAALVGLFACFIAASAARGAVLYTSTRGNDATGTGTTSQPYATLAKAVSLAVSGDTIWLSQGTYTGGVMIRQPNITIRSSSSPGAGATIVSDINNTAVPNNIWFLATGGVLRNVEVVGGAYYAVKFEAGYGVVDGCKIHGSGIGDCVKVVPGADNMIIKNTEIYSAGLLSQGNSQGIDDVAGNHLTVQNCYIHDINDYAAVVKGGAESCSFGGCLIENCKGGLLLGQSTDLSYFNLSQDPGLYENIAGTIENCVIINTQWCGIGLYASLDAQVYNNTLINVAQTAQGGIFLSPSDHYPNGVDVLQTNRYPRIVNNIVQMAPNATRFPVYLAPGSVRGLSLDYNRYYVPDGIGKYVDASGYPAQLAWGGDLAQWQVHLAGDLHSTEGDPMLNANLLPLAGSPCLTCGTAINAFTAIGANWGLNLIQPWP